MNAEKTSIRRIKNHGQLDEHYLALTINNEDKLMIK